MNEALRHAIVQRHQQGASRRAIAEELGCAWLRGVLAQVQARREGPTAPLPAAAPASQPPGRL